MRRSPLRPAPSDPKIFIIPIAIPMISENAFPVPRSRGIRPVTTGLVEGEP